MGTLLVIESSGAPVFTSRYRQWKELGHTLVVARHDLGNDPEAESLVDYLIPVRVHNFENLNEVVDTIVSEAKRLQVEGIITRWDAGVPALTFVSDALGLPTFPLEVAEIIRYKHTMREAFANYDIPSATFSRVQTLESAKKEARKIGYPIILKPSLGYGSWGVVRVNSEEKLHEEFERIFNLSIMEFNNPDLLVEEYLDGQELTVDSIIYQGQNLFTNIVEKPRPMTGENGGFAEIDFVTPAGFSAETKAAILEIQDRIITKLRIFNAVIHTEMRLTSKGPKVLEINPRVPGMKIPLITKLATGVDFEEAALELAFGRKPRIQLQQNNAAAFCCISPGQGGILKSVEGLEEISKLPGVHSYSFHKSIGERILTVPYEIQDQLGYIVTCGNTQQEVLRTLQYAQNLLKLEIADGA